MNTSLQDLKDAVTKAQKARDNWEVDTTTTTNPHTLALAGLVHYSGDIHPLNYNGFWYEDNHWQSDGYASCVEVICLDDGPANGRHVLVSKLTINRPNDMKSALSSCGIEPAHQGDVGAQIEACKAYAGGEPDESDWREPSTYSFVIPDDASDFSSYAKIHDATIASESDVWELLGRLVGRELA